MNIKNWSLTINTEDWQYAAVVIEPELRDRNGGAETVVQGKQPSTQVSANQFKAFAHKAGVNIVNQKEYIPAIESQRTHKKNGFKKE